MANLKSNMTYAVLYQYAWMLYKIFEVYFISIIISDLSASIIRDNYEKYFKA